MTVKQGKWMASYEARGKMKLSFCTDDEGQVKLTKSLVHIWPNHKDNPKTLDDFRVHFNNV